jgi:hypothetical protein
MPQVAQPDPDLPTIEGAALEGVTGGAGIDAMMMLPLLMRRRSQAAAAPPPQPQPVTPTIKVNGVEKQLAKDASGAYSLSTGDAEMEQ